MDFFSALSLHSPTAHLLIRGELDAFAAVQLRRRLDESVDRGCVCFTIDASGITFIDAGGLGSLVRLRNAVTPYGGNTSVTAASPRFRDVVDIVGLGAAFDLDLLPDPTHRSDHRVAPADPPDIVRHAQRPTPPAPPAPRRSKCPGLTTASAR